MNKNNSEMCIPCPVAHIFLSEYSKILELITEKKKAIKIKDINAKLKMHKIANSKCTILAERF